MGFQTGLSGLNVASKSLDIIGNNVANSETVGFKQSRAEFVDMYAASLSGGGNSSIGIGAKLSAVAQQFTQGNISTTENPLDLAISGNGFFRVSADTDANSEVFYTRAGQFKLDNTGYIVNSAGHYLTGYGIDATTGLIDRSHWGPLQVDQSGIPPMATESMELGLNLDGRKDVADADPTTAGIEPINPNNPLSYTYSTSFTVFDYQGNSHSVSAFYQKAAANTWNMAMYMDGDMTTPVQFGNDSVNAAGAHSPVSPTGVMQVTFDGRGEIATINGTAASGMSICSVDLGFPSNAGVAQNLVIDMSQFTQYGSASGVNVQNIEGYASGRLTSFSFESDGSLTGRYSNGQVRNLGQLVLSTFPSVQNLKPVGNTEWVETGLSGSPITSDPNTGTLGSIRSMAVESSNVDLTQELVSMITAQRSYQANAQTIKTQDQVLQTIVNLR